VKLRLAASVFSAVVFPLLLAGCGEHKQARVSVPPSPPISEPQAQATPTPPEPVPEKKESAEEEEKEALSVPPDTRPIFVETGLASWYGAPYHNRRGSNGQVYNMHAMTAAHRTLPLDSIVRVTNVKTGRSALVRITDRGPFIEGRILDLSLAAAKKVDVWQAGLARVRLEVLQTPAPLDTGGRWAVQIGAFDQEDAANTVADRLSHRYHTAKVLCFNSPVGDWWVRVLVQHDDRKRAEEVAHDTQTSQGSIFLVRLD
jgi:peptidoglycan lytic transglycosylase